MGGMNKVDSAFADSELAAYNCFDEFVRGWVNEVNVWKFDHFRPQLYYLTELHGKVQLDFIGRFENIENDFQHVADRLEVSASLPQLNASVHPEYRSLYSNEAKGVARVYAQDIRQLRYEF